jgi:Amt family ammonium transporter
MIAGVVTYYGVGFMERIKIDDPVGAFPVHGLNGIFGVLAVGIWGVDGVGLLHGGGFAQLGIQAIGLIACTLWTLPLAFAMFFAIDKTLGLRVSPEVEAAGIDPAYHGIGSYPEFLTGEGEEPKVKKSPVTAPGAIPAPGD